ncbi:signal peptidase II [Brooklawnia cerclae]|uniref:signal peptidase II n=1 Tax=Brooklawnia cerclae TaxID=349934 RepID=UPI00312C8342
MPITGPASSGSEVEEAAAEHPRVLHGATSTAPPAWISRVIVGVLAVTGLAVDQWTKHLVLGELVPGEPVRVVGDVLTLQLHFNPGAAFSMGTQFTVVLSCLALGVLVAVSTLVAPRVRGRLLAVATGLLLAGVAGNLFDRLFRAPGPFLGHVVDFIALRGFAIFNVADMCITSAAGLFIIWSVLSERRR